MITLAITGILALIALTALIHAAIRDAEKRGREQGYRAGVLDSITFKGNATRFSRGEEL